jgi:hypothetical protein
VFKLLVISEVNSKIKVILCSEFISKLSELQAIIIKNNQKLKTSITKFNSADNIIIIDKIT